MPFCTQCGHQASDTDMYCGACGARQAGAGPGPAYRTTAGSEPNTARLAAPPVDPLSGLTPRTASILCYIPTIGWIPAVIVLAARKFRGDNVVRFHAFQGLYLFAAWLVVSWVVRPLSLTLPDHFVRIDHLLEGVLLGVSIFMMVKASHDETYVLPIIGELAQRSATEH
ncbi:MAG TPA: zinc-ribbon domain-containing protein [Bryobacteraceae bacterium]|jgi:uncharacterized membrane protein|nr:zinc-ribbon domain-containing protein [Bryobacteraceae bacterium]